jgi:hypothetical protein
MKRQILIRKKENKISLSRTFEILTLTFLLFTFGTFVFLLNKTWKTPVSDIGEEAVSVFKESKLHEFLGFEKDTSEEPDE